ncbi:coat protein [Lake Sarah-associated circular virus-41]|uniref:Coat protein n=1 Tax=Lake Sarah-associated circular virus-41 TaxID=1685770 RepID=A0A126G9S9_9VIRU|nr:coat protein [Lake Sarah-associated circular virus-41]ALE29782.1 coat protein [Lake Sarah-associated circular virus-41]ALE29783.1 coat protein [Lake Sarah-associated circular virus-41]
MKRKGHYPTPDSSRSRDRKRAKHSRPTIPSRPLTHRVVQAHTNYINAIASRYNRAVVGDFLGGVPGAIIGAATSNVPFTIKKTIMGRGNPAKKLVQRSAMTSKGKNKLKTYKPYKLSDKFVKSVKQVLQTTCSTGTYVTVRQGLVGTLMNTAASGSMIGNDLGQTGINQIWYPGSSNPAGSRTLFNALATLSDAAATDSTVVAQTGLNFFTPAKIIDAASVLFNNKGLGDPYSSAGNLATEFTTADGSIPTSNTAAGALKINVLKSYVDFEMKNLSNRVAYVDIWECSPTLKFQNINPLQVLQQTAAVWDSTSTINRNITYATANANPNEIFLDSTVDGMGVLKKYAGLPMSWKKRSMVLAPDETCLHTVQGPKGILDWSKLVSTQPSVAPATGQVNINLNCLLKGFSVGCVISVRTDQVFQSGIPMYGAKKTYNDGANLRMAVPVAIEMKESYKVAVPEVAGFVSRAVVGGSAQPLNLRKPRFVLWNQVNANGTTNVNKLYLSNELNPVYDTTQAQG